MDKLSLMLEHSVDFSSIGLKNNSSSEVPEKGNSFEDLIRKAADKIKDAVNPNTQRTDEVKSETKVEAKVEAGADQDNQAKLELAASLVTRQPIAFVDVSADTGLNISKDGIQLDVKADLSVLPQNLVNTNVDVAVGLGRNGLQFNVNAQAGVGQVQQITQEQVTETAVQDTQVQPSGLMQDETAAIPVQANESAQQNQTNDSMAQTDNTQVEVAFNEASDTEHPEEAVETQLFEEVDVVPVKVGEATDAQQTQTTATVDIESADAEQQIGDTVSDAIENGQDTVLVKLNPRNLGEMTVEISKANDGTIGVLLKATSQKTVTILQQHINGLEMQLLSSTHSEVKVEVQTSSESQQTENQMNPDGRNGSNAQKNPQRNPENRAEETKAVDFISQLRLGLVSMEAAV